MKKILFVSSEVFPLIKTGGLADVSASLPGALKTLGQEVVILLPAYREVLNQVGHCRALGEFHGQGLDHRVQLLATQLPDSAIPVWLMHCPPLFDRDGGPYNDRRQQDWPDNPIRFEQFCRFACLIACRRFDLDWQPDIVHANDWQCGLLPAYLSQYQQAPPCLFTIHNMAYQGNYPYAVFEQLRLPSAWWSMEAIEFYHQMSFLKAGLVFSRAITTVSPRYAEEITSARFGHGMEGILQHHREKLHGILNGIDATVWDPARDTLITRNYDGDSLADKTANKLAWQQANGLRCARAPLLIGSIGRLAYQKGVDKLIACIEHFIDRDIQWAILGSGDAQYEQQLRELADRHPDRICFHNRYSETLAHQIEAAADCFLMPSRYEPCGLNQLYSLRYATIPLVSQTGGLADTVRHCDSQSIRRGDATGFCFEPDNLAQMIEQIERCRGYYKNKKIWRQLQRNAMHCDYSWEHSARQYLALYQSCIEPA